MDIQTILVYLIFFVCVVFAVKGFIKKLRKKKGCGCGCGCEGCTMSKKNSETSDCCSSEKK